jgi:hypothetical protein
MQDTIITNPVETLRIIDDQEHMGDIRHTFQSLSLVISFPMLS